MKNILHLIQKPTYWHAFSNLCLLLLVKILGLSFFKKKIEIKLVTNSIPKLLNAKLFR